ncbi:DUF1289 domain-containing protein [Paraburkholderia gardini]|uniref:DUF1289 domain-containing protein n=1 Tax=Paraburkholderia gardini TaxID=2823469 RepID=UPI001E61EE46|nr:DUF1289 domain-containing protein [Paraburkholderia gardini]
MNLDEPADNSCINIFRTDHDDKFCQGCWRTLPETDHQDQVTDLKKADVAALPERRRREKG